MKHRTKQAILLPAAAVLLVFLTSCQGRSVPEAGIIPEETEAAAVRTPAGGETENAVPPAQVLPTPKESAAPMATEAPMPEETPLPEPETPDDPYPADTPPPQNSPALPEQTEAPPEKSAAPTETPVDPPEKSTAPGEPETGGGLVFRGGRTYLSDGSGDVIRHEAGLYDYDGYTYCFHEDGSIAAGETVAVNGSEYIFDDKGRWMSPLRAAVEATSTAEKTSQLVLAVDHNLTFWEKAEDGSWRLRMDTYCGYGGNGLTEADTRVMGTRTTPIGAFPLTLAFGLGPNPGTGMTYRQITETSYWSSEDDDTYNTWVESETPVSGEHLIDYYQYKYAVNIGFNLDPPHHDRGCAIFLHCKSTNSWYTAGCVSLAEEDMLTLLLALRDGAWMIIVPDTGAISAY